MDWHAFIDEASVAALLSEEHAGFARPICEALAVFLSGLPVAAQGALVASQAALPRAASTSQRLGALALQCPVLHKLGQTLARDRRLDPALRAELRKLEVLPPSVPMTTLRRTLRRELGSLADLGVALDSTAIAQASVAVVVGFRQGGKHGVFKILKPGVEERLRLELDLLERVAQYLDERCTELGLPEFGYQEAFQQVAARLHDEVRLHAEQRHLRLAAEHYAGRRRILVPALFPCCTPRVTAMERVYGRKVTEHGLATRRERHELAALLAVSVLGDAVFSMREDAVFHGDPHAGNLLLTPDGRLAMLDWSLAGVLEKHEREAIVHIVVGAMMLDAPRVLRMLARFARGRAPGPDRLRPVVERSFRPIRSGRLPDIPWLLGLIEDAVQRAGLKLRGDVLLLRKSLHTLSGVMADVGACDGTIERSVLADALRRLAFEWPVRALSPPASRVFSTHLSNVDLADLLWSYPSMLGRVLAGSSWGVSGPASSPGI